MSDEHHSDLITIADAARLARTNRAAICDWIATGRLVMSRPGEHRLVSKAQVLNCAEDDAKARRLLPAQE